MFWADAERHRVGRLQLLDARAAIIADAFAALAHAGHTPPGEPVVGGMAARYNALREAQMHLFDGAHHVVDTFRAKGVRLALITNGAAAPQRAKVERFDLTHRFHHIQIEGEHGFGKPEERAYRHALVRSGRRGRVRPGWSATTSNGKLSLRNDWGSTRSGTIWRARGCRKDRPRVRTG